MFFRYPADSGGALLSGVPPFRCCATRFARKCPTWRLLLWGEERKSVLCILLLVLVLMLTRMLCLEELKATGLEDLDGFGRESKQKQLQRILSIKMVWEGNLVPVFGRDCGLVTISYVLKVCHGMMRVFLLSMTGWGFAEPSGHVQTHSSRYRACASQLIQLRVWMRCDVRIQTHQTTSQTTTRSPLSPLGGRRSSVVGMAGCSSTLLRCCWRVRAS